MKVFFSTIAALLIAVPMLASAQQQYGRPCERGPIPSSSLINGANPDFVVFLQQVRPNMPAHIAEEIATQLCADLNLVGDSRGLSDRLARLFQIYGY